MPLPETQILHITEQQAGKSALAALAELLHHRGESRLQLAQRIDHCEIALNGRPRFDPQKKVRTGDVFHVYPYPRTPPPTSDDIELQYLDRDLVIATKPALMTTMRHAEEAAWSRDKRNHQATLVDLLPAVVAAAEGTRPGPRGRFPPVIPVHRLDRDTSGLMAFARNRSVEQELTRQFANHEIERVYFAVARGEVPSGRLTSWLVRDRGDGLRGSLPHASPTAAVTRENAPDQEHENQPADTADDTHAGGIHVDGPPHPDAEQAVTNVEFLQSLGEYSLIACRLETGRTHQIRIHLCESGHPLCGETIYTHRLGERPQPDLSHAPRLALHAGVLGLHHPRSGQPLQFEAPVPADLSAFIRRLS